MLCWSTNWILGNSFSAAQRQKSGRSGSLSGVAATDPIAVRVSESLEARIKGVPRWQAKARQALADGLGDLLESIPDDLVS